jgi:hypothetical protein
MSYPSSTYILFKEFDICALLKELPAITYDRIIIHNHMTITFYDATSCSEIGIYQHFEETCRSTFRMGE